MVGVEYKASRLVRKHQPALTTTPDVRSQRVMAESDSTPVEYRDIPGFPGYRVGNDASVWSCLRNSGAHGWFQSDNWRRLKLRQSKRTRRYRATLYRDRIGLMYYVHRLVLMAFVGPCPEGMEACHNNGDVTDNHPSNLRWDTRKNNHADKWLHGTQQAGEQHPRALLDEASVRSIREMRANGRSLKDIAREFGIAPCTVSAVANRRLWSHVA